MKYPLLLATLLLTAACTSEKTDQTDTSQESEAVEAAESSTCYAAILGQDTLSLRVERMSDDVTGDLAYNFYEKDDNEGTIEGKMHGDTLLADYTFMSEGTESVRQVAFLKKGDGFVEGYGDMEDQNGKMVFKNTAALDFGSNSVFKKVPCNE
ncbi:hypothetical protein [Salmonirosea aquatica]|uniref:Lipoprotein n=1 Tax=Salmonirosea aquatica TaxID=2654236 RepID=A0A7C9FZA2_9BACT|nr:hypothetical protein [Cytophagaceae bacterium SJW1-29]